MSAPHPRRWIALVAVALSVLVIGFDTTVLNVALPDLARQLNADTGQQQWIVDAYTVVFAAAMLPAGLLGDRFGRRRTLVLGLALFGAASVLGTLAGSPATLIAARAAMGLAAAFVMPMSMAVIPAIFPPAEQRRATALLSTMTALGVPLGPIIGGLLLRGFWWGSIFLINVPLVLLGVVACLLLLPESADPAAPRIDLPSAGLAAGGLAALTWGIIEGPERGWGDALVLGALIGAAAALTALVLRSRRREHPMLDLRLLAEPMFRWCAIAVTLVSIALFGGFFVLPAYFRSVLGADALGSGLRLMPMMGGLLVAARLGERLVRRFAPRGVITAGLALIALAMLLGSRTSVGDGYGWTALWLVLFGAGLGLVLITATASALLLLPPAKAGVGAGLVQTLRQVGGAIGVAVFGSLLAAGYRSGLHLPALPADAAQRVRGSVVAADAVAERLADPGLAAAAHGAYVHGMGLVLLTAGLLAAVSAVLVAARMPGAGDPVAADAPEVRPVAAAAGDPGESTA
ncbi:MFS transporter [Kitasatospora sp. CB01950]|uniref:MFS transporter n=1 Tax=Kitasatospora sp. CB01950 TaxID=1703930 RepID=UPI00093D9BB9|nr:MFS transporter [Kitasatospora sp. CB01950]